MPQSKSISKKIAVDVFAGAGGLSVGLKRAGFRVAAAIELDPHAFATYKANHPEVKAFKQDVRTISGKAIKKACGGRVDLLAGCPPCQGFSSLTNTSKKRDPRNTLVMEMARLIKEIQPRAVMMENVPGLADRGKRLFNRLLKTLEEEGYGYSWNVLQVADYGVPQNRRRLAEDYIFDCSYMEHVCTMIGNALPCDFAESLAKSMYAQMFERTKARVAHPSRVHHP